MDLRSEVKVTSHAPAVLEALRERISAKLGAAAAGLKEVLETDLLARTGYTQEDFDAMGNPYGYAHGAARGPTGSRQPLMRGPVPQVPWWTVHTHEGRVLDALALERISTDAHEGWSLYLNPNSPHYQQALDVHQGTNVMAPRPFLPLAVELEWSLIKGWFAGG